MSGTVAMKLAALLALLALLALAYGVDSAAMSYDKLVEVEEMVGEESYPETSPEAEGFMDGPAENTKIPLKQYIQEIEEDMAQQAPITEEMVPDAADNIDIGESVDTVDTAGKCMHLKY